MSVVHLGHVTPHAAKGIPQSEEQLSEKQLKRSDCLLETTEDTDAEAGKARTR